MAVFVVVNTFVRVVYIVYMYRYLVLLIIQFLISKMLTELFIDTSRMKIGMHSLICTSLCILNLM